MILFEVLMMVFRFCGWYTGFYEAVFGIIKIYYLCHFITEKKFES